MDKLKINPSSPEQRLIVLVSKVNLLLSYFETADLTCEGLFRLPGSKKQIVKLEISFVSDSLSVFRSKIEKSTINDTASILKHIIDKMIPAMPESWYLGFKDLKKLITTEIDPGSNEVYSKIMLHFANYPNSSLYDLLKATIRMLNKITRFKVDNKMDAYNLAVVFSQLFIKCANLNLVLANVTLYDIPVFEYLITYYKTV